MYANDLVYLEQILGWLYTRGMYAMIDMHGMPGGQNADPTTGHNTPDYTFFTPSQQARSLQVIRTIANFIKNSQYGNVVSAVVVVNEPCGNINCAGHKGTVAQGDTLRTFYEACYQILSVQQIPMVFHHGWIKGHLAGWSTFVQTKNSALVIGSDNPYPGGFGSRVSSQDALLGRICRYSEQYSEFPVGVVVTEFSMVNSFEDQGFDSTYFKMQVVQFAKGAKGSAFWSYRVAGQGMVQWSWTSAMNRGMVPVPPKGSKGLIKGG